MLYDDVGSLNPWAKYDRNALVNKKLLVIGMGNIGGRVYKKLETFMDVVSWDIENSGIDLLRKYMKTSDCVTLHIPETEENRGFIDKTKLSWMIDESVLVNTARGAIVSEKALFEELRSARLKAAFDVYWDEPYSGRLKDYHPDRFHMTPHVASTCNTFLDGSAEDLRTFVSEVSMD
jgi:phosphoglycerate dehydrogenase-like enzyme